MTERSISGVTIKAVATSVPDHVISEANFAALYGEKEVARIAKGTGIVSIRQGKTLETSDLVCAACESLLSRGIVAADEIDGLLVVTQTPDKWSPGTSYIVQDRLGLSKSCYLSDISAGCAGYVTALAQGFALVASGMCKKVLVCTGDITTKLIDDTDRHLRMLFGDAASATLIVAGAQKVNFVVGADGNGASHLGAPIQYGATGKDSRTIGNLHMDGTAVMNFALSTVPGLVKDVCAQSGQTLEDLDLLVLHQANEFIINYLRRMIDIAPEKLPVDVDGLGNTSSTSIPYVLSRHPAIGTPSAQKVVLCGFGAGLSWGAIHVNLSETIAIPPVAVPGSVPAEVSCQTSSEPLVDA